MGGQFVVRCVVDVVEKRSLFVVAKVGQGFELYFAELCGKRDEKRTGNGKSEMRGSFASLRMTT
jgi:hypothetical protein